MILFCRDDNYDAVAAAVHRALEARPASHNKGKSPLGLLLLRSAMVVIATTPLFYLPDNFEVGSFVPFFILCFALATVWFVPLLAWVVIAALVYILAASLFNGFALTLSLIGEGIYAEHGVLNGDDWAMLALALLGASYLLWFSIATLRGRIKPALMID